MSKKFLSVPKRQGPKHLQQNKWKLKKGHPFKFPNAEQMPCCHERECITVYAVQNQEKDKVITDDFYGQDSNMNFESISVINECEKFPREDNESPASFFTNEYCQICGQRGQLLICENCPKVFHLKCIGLTQWPKDEFLCNYCKGFQQMECARCFKKIQDIDFIKNEQLQNRHVTPFKVQLLPVQCCLCLSQIHTECVDIPVKLLFKGAYYYDLCEKDYHELNYIFEKFKGYDLRLQIDEILELKNKAISLLKGDQVIYHMCRVCQESRGIEVISDIMSLKDVKECDLDKEIDFNDCYSLVKFKHTSFIHSVWVDFSTVEDLGKSRLQGLMNRFKLETYMDMQLHQQAIKLEDYGDKFHNIDVVNMIPNRIVDQFRKGKYYLVKWKNLDYAHCTWEPSYFISKYCLDLKHEFLKMLQTQDLLNDLTTFGAQYRFDIMRSRDFHQYLQPFTPFTSTPSYLYRANESMKLHDYQIEGLNWLIDAWLKKTNVILADEMGLGKTVQTIAYISYLMNVQQITRPFLIVVPLSTIENWIREFQAWCPEARILPYTSGLSKDNQSLTQTGEKSRPLCRDYEFYYELYASQKNKALEALLIPKFNVLITSYQILVSDYKYLASFQWKSIIIDEGQRLKSSETKIFKLALTLITEHRILLSGTPLQNNIGELFNLLEYLDPLKFNSETRSSFQQMFNESVMMKNSSKVFDRKKELSSQQNASASSTLQHQQTQTVSPNLQTEQNPEQVEQNLNSDEQKPKEATDAEVNVETEKSALDSLQVMLQPHILRRFKRDVFKNFPKKKEVILRVEMTAKQKELSRIIIEKNFEALSQFEKQKNSGVKVSLKNADNVLTLLRMIANHPLHLTEMYGTEIFRLRNAINNEQDIQDQLSKLQTYQDYMKDSGKLHYLDKMLDLLIPKGHRILLFTQFRGTMDILCDYLNLKAVKHLRLDGETENLKRQKMIDLFNDPHSEYKIFILSTKAGGLGINLTSADTIVIFDSDFNPHNDIQALNRAHRIGQKNNVMVYRYICQNSVEERIIESAKHKLMLDTMVAHSQKNVNLEESNSLYQILKFGTKKLFEAQINPQSTQSMDLNAAYVVDEEQLQKLLDRDLQFKELEEEEKSLQFSKDDGIKDYLSGFKVANISNKENEQQATKKQHGQYGSDGEQSLSDDQDEEELKQLMNGTDPAQKVTDNSQQKIADDNDNMVFERLLKELKDKQQHNKDDMPLNEVFDNGIKTRNRLKEIYSNSKNPPKPQHQSDSIVSEDKINLQEPVKAYLMTPEYAEFIGGLSSGKYQLHHDGHLYLAQLLGQMTSLVSPLKRMDYSLDYQKNNQDRITLLQNLITKSKFKIDHLRILLLNENPQIEGMLFFIKLWGFDIMNIRDFVDAFMQFGFEKNNFSKLYNKIETLSKSCGYFSSLTLVHIDVFKEFCRSFFEFWRFIIVYLKSFADVPQFIFGQRTAQELSMRNYELHLLRAYTEQTELLQSSSCINLIQEHLSMNSGFKFGTTFDSYMLCKLILAFGYDRYREIIQHHSWTLMNTEALEKLQSQINLNHTSLKQLMQTINALEGESLESIYPQSLRPDYKLSKIILLQKLSGITIESYKQTLAGEKGTVNLSSLNDSIENYCSLRLQQLKKQILDSLQKAQSANRIY